jgi:sec-independent protein translocase protein TatA
MSIPHLIVLALIALIVLGPEKMPQAARTLGKFMAELRRMTGDFRSTVEGEMREMERQAALKEMRQNFPENVHYDLMEEKRIAAESQPATPAAPAAETETPPVPGKPSNGEPTPA